MTHEATTNRIKINRIAGTTWSHIFPSWNFSSDPQKDFLQWFLRSRTNLIISVKKKISLWYHFFFVYLFSSGKKKQLGCDRKKEFDHFLIFTSAEKWKKQFSLFLSTRKKIEWNTPTQSRLRVGNLCIKNSSAKFVPTMSSFWLIRKKITQFRAKFAQFKSETREKRNGKEK
jgi:hypothetical protein